MERSMVDAQQMGSTRTDEVEPDFDAVVAAVHRVFDEKDVTAAADALRSPATRLTVTTADEIAARTDPWDPASVPTTPPTLTSSNSDEVSHSAEDLVSAAQAELDAQIGLTSVKEQVAKLQSAATVAS